MKEQLQTLGEFIIEKQRDFKYSTGEFSRLISSIRIASKMVNRSVNKAGIANILGTVGNQNIQGEEQQKLDVMANEIFIQALSQREVVCGIASEENDDFIEIKGGENSNLNKYVVLIDPLDGSSNIDVNVSVGTIFSIYRRITPEGTPVQLEDFLQKGINQVAAGYIVYGASTMLVYTTGNGVNGFTLDPSIGTLQPVLNSYWLMIHVAVIVGSYGPFALGMILGIINLFLIIFTNKKNINKIKAIIKELSIVNELSLTVGLIMLTIGNFLGAQWANESWGRYWGWDPKETWALVSIMVYAFVVHMRIVPGLRGSWAFNFMSVASFASIIMTYFGVNFYLSGLHSYASGEKVITPNFVYYAVVFVILLGIISFFRYKKEYKNKS